MSRGLFIGCVSGVGIWAGACRQPASVVLSAPATISPCEAVTIQATLSEGATVQWSVEGLPLLYLDPIGPDTVSFRAPVVNTETPLTITAVATDDRGETAQASVQVVVPASPPSSDLAEGMAWDCAPFAQGVASGDPMPDAVLLWTRLTTDAPSETVSWIVATDPFLQDVVASGETSAEESVDHTVHVEVTDLEPSTHYYYQFRTSDGTPSVLGRTRTAPDGPVDQIRIASVSCSSVYSGWFNAYARMAERDLDLVMHMGDYVYDFVDAEEEVRIPEPYPQDPSTLAEWRERFRYYRGDPDMRMVHAAHPWFMLWDNHDSNSPDDGQGTVQAFREYIPMRQPDPDNPYIVYRHLAYGDLLDLYMIDALRSREEGDILGADQRAWLEAEVQNSTATWRVIGSQKLISLIEIPQVVSLNASPWNGYPESRAWLFGLLQQKGDNILLTGDLHFTVASDLVTAVEGYDPASSPSAGVELLSTSVTRGNFDETLCGGLCDDDSREGIEQIGNLLASLNPQIGGLELIEHGYGVITVTEDAIDAEVWYSVIREHTDEETLGLSLRVEAGTNRWRRE